MKIAPRDSAAFLGTGAHRYRAALLYGPDGGQVREAAQALALSVVKDLKDAFNVVELSEARIAEDPAILSDEMNAMSFTGDRRLVMLRDGGDKSARAIEAALEQSGESAAFLLVCADELSPRSSLRQLFEKSPAMAAFACYKDEGRSLEQLITQAFQADHVRCDRDAMAYLCAQLGNDRGVTRSEIEKLALYVGQGGTVTLEIARELVDTNNDVFMEDACHHIALGQETRLEAALDRLRQEGTPAIALVRAALRHFQKLEWVRAKLESGMSAEDAVASLRPPVFFKQAPLWRQQVLRWSGPAIRKALASLVETEIRCKQLYPVQDTLLHAALQHLLRLGNASAKRAA